MPQSNNKPWKARWHELRQLGQGGQGTASLVEPLDTSIPAGQYVLKVLNSPNDPDRRGRMYREVAALNTLSHPGVPRVIESNAGEYTDLRQHLYLVTEYIEGQTLEERVACGRLTVSDAADLLMRLTDIVLYCHDRGVIHRDIKPDNVVVRGNAAVDPVLLDFGQSFNQEVADERPLTATGQHLGNRFLALPELQLNSGNKRDTRSDLTQLCGLLLFVLSGERPITLLDDASRLPHQRPVVAEVLGQLPPDQRTRLNRIFDTGFAVAIDRRFQSAQALQASLRLVAASTTDAHVQDAVDVLSRLQNRLSGPLFTEREQFRALFVEIDRILHNGLRNVQQSLGAAITTTQGGYTVSMARLTYGNKLGLRLVYDETREFFPRFTAVINGSEIVVAGKAEGRETELIRVAIAGPHRWDQLLEAATEYFVDGFAAKCEDL